MTPIDLSSYATEEISVAYAEPADRDATLTFRGTLEHPNPSVFLDPMLEEVHARQLTRGGRRLVLDFSALEFMNSSGIKSLIRYVMRLASAPAEQRYEVVLTYSPEVTWQYTSLKAVAMLARGGASVVESASPVHLRHST